MVSTWTASASDSSRRLRSSSPVSAPASAIRLRSQAVSAVDAELLVRRGGVQQLTDVAQVGQPALAVGVGEHPRGQLLGRRRRSSSAATPRSRSTRAQSCSRRWTSSHSARRRRPAPAARRPSREGGQRRRAGARELGRAFERLQQRQPVARALGPEHAAGAVDQRPARRRRRARRGSGRRGGWCPRARRGRRGDRSARRRVVALARRQQRDHVVGEIGATCARRAVDRIARAVS